MSKKFIEILQNSLYFQWYKQKYKKFPEVVHIPKSLKKYKENLEYFLTMPKKQKYDKTTKYPIAYLDGKEIYTTEFLMAKQLGYLPKFQGHSELREYLKLLPYLFYHKMFDGIYKNISDDRIIYAINENSRKIFHVIDSEEFLVSVFVVSEINFKKQLNRRFKLVQNLDGGTATPHILSPARPFWRHPDLIEQLYRDLEKNSITQEDFFSAKEIDNLVFKLYGLSQDEINLVKLQN